MQTMLDPFQDLLWKQRQVIHIEEDNKQLTELYSETKGEVDFIKKLHLRAGEVEK